MATILFNEGHPGPKYAQETPTKKQLLNNIIDGMARTRPMTYSALANAVNGIAWWLTDQLGLGFGKDFPTICYMGWNDLRYVTMVLGAMKAGYKILLVSPYNGNEGNISLFNGLDCQVLATTDPAPLGVPVLPNSMPKLRTITVPNVNEFLDKSYKHFPFSKTYNETKNEPLVCLHTSGTTGLPKLVIYSHDFVSTYMRMAQLVSPEGFESREKQYQGTRVFMNLPPFHASISPSFNFPFAASSINALSESLANQNIVIFPLPMERATASSLVEIMKYTPVDALCAPPGMVHEIATSPEILEELVARKLDAIWYGGGDLPQQFGDIITSKFKFWNSNESTETSPFPNIYKSGELPAEYWKYKCTHPAAGLEYRVFSDDDQLYEAVNERNCDPEFENPVFKLYPDLKEYSTKDLFSPHPTKAG
ncbi:putative nrps-like enzyme protein [Botrytis fragariae]|uniref:Putative nrps-like enzyme protein n=1 Tax=Botrytis fragariae TaxID=1964551 RepID=A0A8H6EHM3_9HELO|nr:putative nrps-like enzyme protein [Botrytis fragariae]KAF5872506.1 putative nrps-like enzyme protein [Botrytis fragariae]